MKPIAFALKQSLTSFTGRGFSFLLQPSMCPSVCPPSAFHTICFWHFVTFQLFLMIRFVIRFAVYWRNETSMNPVLHVISCFTCIITSIISSKQKNSVKHCQVLCCTFIGSFFCVITIGFVSNQLDCLR